MNIDLAALPDDIATLHRIIGELATILDSGAQAAYFDLPLISPMKSWRNDASGENIGYHQLPGIKNFNHQRSLK